MGDPDFDDRLARLAGNLDEIATLMREHGEAQWLAWASRCRGELARFDGGAFDHVLGAFGGMGSLNDLVIPGLDGQVVRTGEERAVNDRLDELRGAIWDDASALRQFRRERPR